MEECGSLFCDTKDDKLYIIDPDDCVFKECGECHLTPFITIFSFVFENIFTKGSQILYKNIALYNLVSKNPTIPSQQNPPIKVPYNLFPVKF